MNKENLRIIFMGTPDFAVPSLHILVENGYEVVGVVTATDKFGGRGGKQLIESAVKKYAIQHNIPVLQPERLKAKDFLKALRALKANLQIVVAFRMLPEVVWNMPNLGTFNLHGSLLPKYRGAAPINWAVINGEQETGVTTFFLQHEIDTGDILFQAKLEIGENETAGEVHDRMMQLGGNVVLKTVQALAEGNIQTQPQDDTLALPAPKIFHETCEINFDNATDKVHNFIRGLSPYPSAWTMLDSLEMKISQTTKIMESHNLTPGSVFTNNKNFIRVATKDGFVEVHELQLQGRKRMSTKEFLNGYKFAPDTQFTKNGK